MAIGADSHPGMRGMVPVFILCIHDMTIVASGRGVFQISWRVRGPDKYPQRGQGDCDPNDK